jgi:HlyD family secretion protein
MVSTKVSASGALAAVTTQALGFAKAAQLTEVDVKVGDTVRAGQVLAREDPFSFQQLLNQQQAQLNNQQAILDRITRGTTVGGDHNTLDQAKKLLDATKDNGDANPRQGSERGLPGAAGTRLRPAAVRSGRADVPGRRVYPLDQRHRRHRRRK